MNHLRDLLRKRQLTFAVIALAMLLTLACGSSGASVGGILVRAHATDPAGFDPVQDSSINTLDLIAPIYSQLVRMNPEDSDGPLVPELAERWDRVHGGRYDNQV